jgi:hypothetical protein
MHSGILENICNCSRSVVAVNVKHHTLAHLELSLRCGGDESAAVFGNEFESNQNLNYFCRIRALLCYRKLRVSYYPPRAVHLLEDMQAAVRLSLLFAILRALDGSSVRHYYNVRA